MDKKRNSYLLRTYGINEEQYNDLLEKQEGCCAVCRRHHTEFKIRLAVEHSHVTKEIRGLVCSYCNLRIIGRHTKGFLLANAATYLDRPGTGFFVPVKPKKKRKKK